MSVKFFARNSRAGDGCANFMGTWDFWVFLQGKKALHAHNIPRFGGGGVSWFFVVVGGGGVPILFFMGPGIFLTSGSSSGRS